jgi:glutathione S-transferase
VRPSEIARKVASEVLQLRRVAMITISALRDVPSFAHGLVRDLRVRWALEEAGLPYRARVLVGDDQASPEYRACQPFGQVPIFEEDGLVLFESGSILLHIGERSEKLLPTDPAERARAVTWVFAALNSIETKVAGLVELDILASLQAGMREWTKLRRPEAEAAVKQRLADLASWLGGRDYLENRFTAGDLMMTTVLRILRHTDLVKSVPSLAAYQARCEARPAFQRALTDHMAAFAPG